MKQYNELNRCNKNSYISPIYNAAKISAHGAGQLLSRTYVKIVHESHLSNVRNHVADVMKARNLEKIEWSKTL